MTLCCCFTDENPAHPDFCISQKLANQIATDSLNLIMLMLPATCIRESINSSWVCDENNPNPNYKPCLDVAKVLHRHKHKDTSSQCSHTSSSAYLSPHHTLLSDRSCSSVRSGSHSVRVYPMAFPTEHQFHPITIIPAFHLHQRGTLLLLHSHLPFRLLFSFLTAEFGLGHPHAISVLTSYCDAITKENFR